MKKIFILVLILTAAISGCSEKKTEPVSRDLFAMDTYMNLKAYGDDSTLSAIDKAAEKITELEEIFSVTNEKSDIWNINHAEGRRVIVNKETAEKSSKNKINNLDCVSILLIFYILSKNYKI